MRSIERFYYEATHVETSEKIEQIAARLGYKPSIEACRDNECMGVIANGAVTAVPFEKSIEVAWDEDFFLLTTIPELGAVFHKEKNKPVWFCQDIGELRQIMVPYKAGQKWAYFLTEAGESWDAQIIASPACRRGRVISVNGGNYLDLLRTFFPDEWGKIDPEQ